VIQLERGRDRRDVGAGVRDRLGERDRCPERERGDDVQELHADYARRALQRLLDPCQSLPRTLDHNETESFRARLR
jgi:hypothetical protein